MPEYSQESRIIAIQTPLGDNVLLLQQLTGTEGISRLFSFHLELLSESSAIVFDDIIGRHVTITIHLASGEDRYVNGMVSRFIQRGQDRRFTHYQAEVVPWMWYLTRNANCRIFQKMTVLEIIKVVFGLIQLDFKDKTQGSYETREYVVQYRETDFNFVSRLMEEYGIFYYFEHEVNKHTLILADGLSAHPPCPHQEKAIFDSTARVLEEERITAFQIGQEFRTGAYTLNDYNFETPLTNLDASEPTVLRSSIFELYDYPGIYLNKSAGENLAKIRMQEQEATYLVGQGAGSCGAFTPGYRFHLEDHYRKDLNKSYVLTEVRHDANCGGAYYTASGEEDETYTNQFEVIPHAVPYRPQRTTPRPLVQGPQTAVVVGPSGEEIYVDKYGRVKVQFYWDRESKANENSSCWIRVSQLWAGKHWGAMWIPRIGQEVIVDFLEGDPDRPIITGRVYNADQMPPYPLPEEKTKSTIKSYSSKGGGGFNEIRFEDKKDKEQIFIHGQKNLDIRIQNDRMEWIGHDRNLIVKRDKMEKVERDSHIQGTRDQIAKIGRDHHLTIGGKEAVKIKGSQSLSVTGDFIGEFKGNHSSQVTQNLYLKATQLVIEALTGLTLKVGSNFITIDGSGVAIQGTLVQLNSAGAALSGSPGSLVSPLDPNDPTEADNAEPGSMSPPSGRAHTQPTLSDPGTAPTVAQRLRRSAASNAPTHDPNAPENRDKKSWIEIELVGEDGQPIPGEPYRVTLADGTTVADGTLDEKGHARIDNIDPGTCKVTFPNRDRSVWRRA